MKLNKRFLALLLAVTMMLGMLPVFAAAAGDITASYDVSDATGDDGKIGLNEPFALTLNWSNVTPGDSVEYTTPAGFKLFPADRESITQDIYNKDNEKVATYTVAPGTNNSTVTITIIPVDGEATGSGNLLIDGKFVDLDAADEQDGNPDGFIQIPGDDKYPIYKPETPEQQGNILLSKEGEKRVAADGSVYLHYKVFISAQNGDLTNVTVVDTPDSGVKIKTDTVTCTSIYDLPTTENNGTYTWNVGNISNGQTVVIEYDAEILEKGDGKFSNYVTATSGAKTTSASEEVSLDVPQVSKTGEKKGNTITWTIVVTFNDYESVHIRDYSSDIANIMMDPANTGAQYTVTYSSGRTDTGTFDALIDGNGIELKKQDNETGATITFQSVIPTNWGVSHNEVENTVFIYYGEENTGSNTSATIEVDSDRITSKSGVAQTQNYGIDNQAGGPPRINWTVTLNLGAAPSSLYKDPVFVDVLKSTYDNSDSFATTVDHRYVEGSFKLYRDGTLVDWQSYTDGVQLFTYNHAEHENTNLDTWLKAQYTYEGGNTWKLGFSENRYNDGLKGFYFKFKNSAPEGQYRIEYQTEYTPSKTTYTSDTLSNYFFANNRENESCSVNVNTRYISKTVLDAYTDNYTFKKSEVDWHINFVWNQETYWDDSNQEKKEKLYINPDAGGIVITDTLPEGFKVKTVKFYEESRGRYDIPLYEGDEWNKPTNYYTVNGNTLTICLRDVSEYGDFDELNGHYVDYLARLEVSTDYELFDTLPPGEKTNGFINSAQLTLNGTKYSPVQASVYFETPEMITKSINYNKYNAPRPEFEICVNPEEIDLRENSDEISVRDEIMTVAGQDGPKQMLLPETLKVYEVNNGNESELNTGEYEVSVNDAKTEFVITGLKDQQKYIIKYNTFVDVEYVDTNPFTLKNRAYLVGVKRDMDGDGDLDDVYAEEIWTGTVVLPNAMGDLDARYSYVFVNKMDPDGNPLAGAEFTIYEDAECQRAVGKITSTSEGLTNAFKVDINKTYYMKETKAPEGYELKDEVVYKFGRFPASTNQPEDVDNIETPDGKRLLKIYPVVNVPAARTTSLTIKKSGGESDESFLMTVEGEGCNLQIVVPANGSVTIDGLLIGETYTVTEDATWAKRYNYGKGASASIVLEAEGNEVTISNNKTLLKWLYGDSSRENRWNESGDVYEVQ